MDTRSTIAVTVMTLPETAQPEQEQQAEELEPQAASADPALVETLRAGFGWQYPAAAPGRGACQGQRDQHRPQAGADDVGAARRSFPKTASPPPRWGRPCTPFWSTPISQRLRRGMQGAGYAGRGHRHGARAAGGGKAHRAGDRREAGCEQDPPLCGERGFARIRAAKQVLRELAFITALPASAVLAAQGVPGRRQTAAAQARVLVQGIADIVLVLTDHLELLDYKTDRAKRRNRSFVTVYRAQLDLYALAVGKALRAKARDVSRDLLVQPEPVDSSRGHHNFSKIA